MCNKFCKMDLKIIRKIRLWLMLIPLINYPAYSQTINVNGIVVYTNSFETPQDTVGFHLSGQVDFSTDVPPDAGSKSIYVSGGCVWPHASIDLGPFDEDGLYLLRCWGKNLSEGGYIFIEVKNDIPLIQTGIYIDKKEWTFYECERTLFCPAGKKITLSMSAGGLKPSAMLVDKVEIIRFPFDVKPPQISEDAVVITLREQSSVFLDSSFAFKVDSTLKRIRNEIDTLKYVHVRSDYSLNSLIVCTNSEWSKNWNAGNLLTGDPMIDSLSEFYNLVSVIPSAYSSSFELKYAQPLKISLLEEIYKHHPDIYIAEPNYYIGDGDNIEFVNKDSLWHFVFSIGRGDCTAGCIYRYYWYVTVNPNDLSSVVELKEERERDYTIPIIYRWNIPGRYTMTMFENTDAVFDSIKYADNWWVRRHAIEGINLFFQFEYPWGNEDLNDHWYELKEELSLKRNEIIDVLNIALNDPDEDVRNSAEKTLQNLLINGIVKNQESKPNSFQLSQNYPNPFNPTTTIDFQIPVSGHVSLKVFDILGREVATLINDFVSAGSHTVKWDGSKSSTGIYIYTITSGNQLLSRKMLLLK